MKSLISEHPLTPILDLGMHPYADTFIPDDKLHLAEPIYPLAVGMNAEDKIIQTLYPTPADDRYNLYDYSYTSANSNFSRTHWKNFANTMIQKLNLNKNAKILEIGSNDGFLCKQFMNAGFLHVMGLDASEKMVKLANANKIITMMGLFGETHLNSLEQYDLIIANNVFNHSNNPYKFIKAVQTHLTNTGTFVFEVPYWASMINADKIDQIYHEHVTYFTVAFIYKLLEHTDLKIQHIEEVDYHGGSLRCYIGFDYKVEADALAIEHILDEHEQGLFDNDFYIDFSDTLNKKRMSLLKKIIDLKEHGQSVVGVGAAAKGNTLLNWLNVDYRLINFVTDSSLDKIGKFTPGSRIMIVPDETLEYTDNGTNLLFLAWNIKDILLPKLLEINPTLRVIE